MRAFKSKVYDSLALDQMEANTEPCMNRLTVWGNKKHFLFAAETDNEFEPWINASKSFLSSIFSGEEIADKKNAYRVSINL